MGSRLMLSAVPLMLVSGLGLLLSVLREVSIAHGFGASWSSDAYFVAVIPVMVMTALGTDLGLALLPLYVRWRAQAGQLNAWHLFRGTWRRVLLVAVLLAAVVAVSASLWVPLVAPGMPGAAQSSAISMIWLLAPGLALLLPAFLWHARANAHHRFAWPQLAVQGPNLGIIAGALLLATTMGVTALAAGHLTGLLLQAVALLWLARVPREPRTDDPAPSTEAASGQTRTFFVIWTLVVVGSLMSKLEPFLQRYYASGLGAGEISTLVYAQRLTLAPNLLFTTALATVAFPRLSELAATPTRELGRRIGQLVLASGGALVVMAAALYFLRTPVVTLLLEYGQFDSGDSARTATVLGTFCIGMVPLGLAITLLRCALVLDLSRVYAVAGVLSLATYWLTAHLLVDSLGTTALALANATGNGALALVLGVAVAVALRKRR